MSKETIKNLLRPAVHAVRYIHIFILSRFFPMRLANMRYMAVHHRNIDWKNPRNIDEKINWMKFYSDTSQWVVLADKYRVRQYVEKCGLGDMLVQLYGKWDRPEDIDWDGLPQQFVMKANNGSGDILFCHDKTKVDRVWWTKKFKQNLKKKYGYNYAEIHYRFIPPCVIAEEMLDPTKQAFPSSSLIDYKIWSFNGKPAYIWACYDRTPHSVEVMTFDLDWNEHPEFSVDGDHYRLSHKHLPRPASLEKMLDAAARLSKGFPAVRVDLYETDGKPYFGEMTFTSMSGYQPFYTEEFLNILGDMTELK